MSRDPTVPQFASRKIRFWAASQGRLVALRDREKGGFVTGSDFARQTRTLGDPTQRAQEPLASDVGCRTSLAIIPPGRGAPLVIEAEAEQAAL